MEKKYKLTKKLNEKISNPIIRGIVLIIFYIIIIILFLPSMPYAIVRGVCNLEYYEEWYKFIANLKKYL